MTKKIKFNKGLFVVLFSFAVIGLAVFAPHAHAAIVNCGNSDNGSVADGCKFSDFFSSAVVLVNYLLEGAAVVAVGGVVYGGYLMVTSAGDEAKRKSGKTAVTNSMIGLAIILIAYLLVRSVFTILGFKGGGDPLDKPSDFLTPGAGINIVQPPN
jgi:hypothetical protein